MTLMKSPNKKSPSKKKRRTTVMKALTKNWSGTKIIVEFNANGVPKGRRVRTYLYGWIGTLARSIVPLSDSSKWTDVPNDIKGLIWDGVLARFEVDIRYRKKILQSAGSSWKNFKNHLTKKYIYGRMNDLEELKDPPIHKYDFIKKDDWERFVESRLTPEFMEKSKMQSKRRKLNLYDHRISRLGYAGLLDGLEEQYGEKFVENIDRSDLWRFARLGPDGEFLNDETRDIALKIDDLKEELRDGNITIQGTDDILTKALGTQEHSGRVRGVGKFVTPSSYFNLPRRGSIKEKDEMLRKKDELLKKKEEELRETNEACKSLKEKVRELELMIQQGTGSSPSLEKVASNSGKSDNTRGRATSYSQFRPKKSNESKEKEVVSKLTPVKKKNYVVSTTRKINVDVSKPLFSKNGQVRACRLALGSKANIVAEGTVFEKKSPNDKIHNKTLGEENVRVAITVAKKESALLPVPIEDEIVTVGDAIGTHVAWPEKFVLINEENGILKINDNIKKTSILDKDSTNKIVAFTNRVKNMNDFEHFIPMEEGVFEIMESHFAINKDEILDVCRFKELNANCLIAYIRFLYENYESSRQKYGFCYPSIFNGHEKQDEMTKVVMRRLNASHEGQLIILPYNPGYHWVLLVIDMSEATIYFMDSLRQKPDETIKLVVTSALQAIYIENGKRCEPRWFSVECPRQSGGVECGYYTMIFMKYLFSNPNKSLKTKLLELRRKKEYTTLELEEFRCDFIAYIEQFLDQ